MMLRNQPDRKNVTCCRSRGPTLMVDVPECADPESGTVDPAERERSD